MKRKLGCILLIDDNYEDNYYHQIIIGDMDVTDKVEIANGAHKALEFLKSNEHNMPELIFLDINMPRMNGWEFLEAYKTLNPDHKSKSVIIMLTTSQNPSDMKRAESIQEVSGFEVKPLSEEILNNILNVYFKS